MLYVMHIGGPNETMQSIPRYNVSKQLGMSGFWLVGASTMVDSSPLTLRPYQNQGVDFLRANPRAYLADEQGLGKSVQLIHASEGQTLIVAPAMLVDSGMWQGEVDKWADDPSRFTITAYSRLAHRDGRKLTNKLADPVNKQWDTVIFDEAHYLISRDSIRSKMSVALAKQSERVYLASGTPIPNHPHELFVPLQMLNPSETRAGMMYGSYWRFVERWFNTVTSFYGKGAVDIGRLKGCSEECDTLRQGINCEHYAAYSMANLKGKMLRRLRDDVLQDLPELQHQRIPVPMTTKQWSEYRSMRETYIAEVEDTEIIAWSGASRHMHLDRMTTGVGVLGDGDDLTAHSGKFDRLREDLLGRNRPTLVVAHFRRSVEGAAMVARELGKTVEIIHGGTSVAERERIVTAFQAGQVDVLAGSFDTISEGLTLTAADMCILLELSYKAARNEQAIRRIHRIGQTRGCLVYEYFATGPKGQRTLDAHKRDLVDGKIISATKTLQAATVKSLL